MIKYRNLTDRVACFLFSVIPFVDAFNGYLIRKKDGNSIGFIYKMLLCIFLLLLCLFKEKMRKGYLVRLCAVFVYVIFTVAINSIFSSVTNCKADFVAKLFFNISLYYLLHQVFEKRLAYRSTLHEILDNASWVFSLCFLIPYFLGMGEHTYSGELGYKGFFYSQNEISLVIIVLFYFVLFKLENRLHIVDVIQMDLLLLCALLLNTKSVIIACAMGLLHWTCVVLSKQKAIYKIGTIILIVVGIIAFRNTIIRTIETTIIRVTALNNNYGGASLATLISGRNYKLDAALQEFQKDSIYIKLIKSIIGNGFWSKNLVEMDLIDTFFYLGIIGVIVVVIFLYKRIKDIRKNTVKDNTRIRFLGSIILISFAFVTGHVIFYATSGCFFVLALCYNELYANSDYVSIYRRRKIGYVKEKEYNS